MRSCGGIPPRRSTRRICSRLDALISCRRFYVDFMPAESRTACMASCERGHIPNVSIGRAAKVSAHNFKTNLILQNLVQNCICMLLV